MSDKRSLPFTNQEFHLELEHFEEFIDRIEQAASRYSNLTGESTSGEPDLDSILFNDYIRFSSQDWAMGCYRETKTTCMPKTFLYDEQGFSEKWKKEAAIKNQKAKKASRDKQYRQKIEKAQKEKAQLVYLKDKYGEGK